jgi:hypothetical protein
MNARQKAKHYKKLYEEILSRPLPVIYQTTTPTHYRARLMMNNRDIAYGEQSPSLLKTHIENGILRELRPMIWDNLKTEKDIYTDKYIYSLDVWM